MKHFRLLLIVLLGCATAQTIEVSKRTRNFNADLISTFRASLAQLTNQGYPIEKADKDIGILNTDWLELGGTIKALGGNQRLKVNLVIQPLDSSRTRVIASISWQHTPGGGQWKEAMISESQAIEKYNEIFNGIQSILVGK